MVYNTPTPQTLYSARHYSYGEKIYNFDVDSVEYNDNDQPVLVVETKHARTKEIDLNSKQFRCLKNTYPHLPIICLVYYIANTDLFLLDEWTKDPDIHWVQFNAIAVNDLGKELLGQREKQLSEYEWVKLLYNLKNKEMPRNLHEDLCDKWIWRWAKHDQKIRE